MNIPSERTQFSANGEAVVIPVTVHGKTFNISCMRGDEARVEQLAEFVNQRIHENIVGSRTLTETGLYSMTLLSLAEELMSLRSREVEFSAVAPVTQITESETNGFEADAEIAARYAEMAEELHKLREEKQNLTQENQQLQTVILDLSKKNEAIAARINQLCETV